MPYIDHTGQLRQSAPLWSRIQAVLLAIFNMVRLFLVTLVGGDAGANANRRGPAQGRTNGSRGGSSGGGGDMATLRRRGEPAVQGFYGEAPCCGR